MSAPIHVLAFSGSLRKNSYNTALLHLARELKPDDLEIEIFDLASIPLYNGDLEAEGVPQPVTEFKERIRIADALLIATPEYNYSVSGVLKNALDWASRPYNDTTLSDKPVGIIGAGGMKGTVRAQAHLRYICLELGLHPMGKPEIMIERPWEKFDATGKLLDESIADQFRAFLVEFSRWSLRFK
ncbi:NADPH-dependent FMN reductase [Candidatus Chlorohelix sp.]|uniref:NADPH-dependent FMN reductase n=1 Tax=Candidatus Chlorohelix sp. TaxID=3139201 RepID=UPI0030584ED3